MRIESLNLPQAALNHRKANGAGKDFPDLPTAKAAAAAGSQAADTENLAASPLADIEKAAKTAPKDLENAISRLEAKDHSTSGTEQALSMLNRNLARYQATTPVDTGSTEPTANSGETTDNTVASA